MIKRIPFFGLVLALSLASCNDGQDITPSTTIDNSELTTTSEDLVSLEYLTNETEEVVDAFVEMREPGDPGNQGNPAGHGDCPEITSEKPRGEFPNTLTIDFGDACEHNGHVRSGKIVATQTAPMNENGASRTLTYEDYFTDGIQHTGTKVMTNAGFDEDGNITFIRYVDLELLFPGGQSASWTAEYIKTQVTGADTDTRKDDVFEISGSATGISRNGYQFTSTIIENLVRRRDCKWLTAGIITFEAITDEGSKSRTIDYGFPEGGCDNLAEVTLADGTVQVIRIHKRRW